MKIAAGDYVKIADIGEPALVLGKDKSGYKVEIYGMIETIKRRLITDIFKN